MNPVALFDFDDTLIRYKERLLEDLTKDLVQQFNLCEDEVDKDWILNAPPHIYERIKHIRNQDGWWESLDEFEEGFDLLLACKNLGYDIHILTFGPSSSDNAWSEKKRWFEKHIRPVVRGARLNIVQDKSRFHGNVLVDDSPRYMLPWLERWSNGLGIMPLHHYNAPFQHERLVHYNVRNFDEVINALSIAYNLKPNQPLRLT